MTLYIYKVSTLEIVAIFTGETNEECEAAAFEYLGVDEYGACYSEHGQSLGDELRNG